jgi:hypothetical protein
MKIMSDGPVDLCFSNANATKKPGLSASTISTIGQSAAQIGSALAQRQRQFTEVEQKCGKKPLFKGKERDRWNNCATEYAKTAGVTPTTFTSDIDTTTSTTTNTDRKIPTWIWIVGGIVIAGGIGFAIYKSTKK